jgi:starch synthase
VGQLGIQLVVLGSGEAKLEAGFRDASQRYSDAVGYNSGFHNALAHLIYAGSDFFLMPSLFEPCGLSQLYSMLYGTVPVARATGGLRDTVIPFDAQRERGTGFLFEAPRSEDLETAIGRAISVYREQPDDFAKLRERAMKQDFSWRKAAEQYVQVYEWAVSTRR